MFNTQRTVWFLAAALAIAGRASAAEFTLLGTVRETFDDNITYVSRDPKQDWITELAGGARLRLEQPVRRLDLSGLYYQQLFARNSSFNNAGQQAALDFFNEFSEYSRFSLKDTFDHSHEPRSFEDNLGRTGGRFSYFRNRLAADYSREISSRIQARARYVNEADWIDRQGSRDSFLNGAGAGLDYAWASTFKTGIGYDYSHRHYNPGRTAFGHGVYGRIRSDWTEHSYLEARGGMDVLKNFDASERREPNFQVSLNHERERETLASLAFERRHQISQYVDDLFDFYQVTAQFRRQVLPRLAVGALGFYGNGQFVTDRVRDIVWGAQAKLIYDLLERVKAELSYAHTDLDSTFTPKEFKKNTVSLAVNAEF